MSYNQRDTKFKKFSMFEAAFCCNYYDYKQFMQYQYNQFKIQESLKSYLTHIKLQIFSIV
jgi:hypothetical protein